MTKTLQLKKGIFLIKNCNAFISRHPQWTSVVKATGEAFSPQKRTSSTSKHISLFLLFF
jgi:hypothetical protein